MWVAKLGLEEFHRPGRYLQGALVEPSHEEANIDPMAAEETPVTLPFQGYVHPHTRHLQM